jgi:hypothetical protein
VAGALAVVVWDVARRHWTPNLTVSTEHYTINSSATAEQAEEIGIVAEILYTAYGDFLRTLDITPRRSGRLKIKLFRDREEFRFCNRVRGWAEAFYRKPYCYQYYSAAEVNPYHWMVHEATHQLNEEVADLSLAQWLEEGIASYFGTSRIVGNELVLGEIDTNTYPIWQIHSLAASGDLKMDKDNNSIIPLRSIISGQEGPDMDEFFNLYYLHWWSLTHFLFHGEDGKYRAGVVPLLQGDCGIEDFERHIGDIERIEQEWYEYVRDVKRELDGRRTPPTVLAETRGRSEHPTR